MARSYGIEYRQGQGPEMNDKRIMFEQLFRYYKGLPHQAAAIQELEKDIEENGYDIAMRRDRDWLESSSLNALQLNGRLSQAGASISPGGGMRLG